MTLKHQIGIVFVLFVIGQVLMAYHTGSPGGRTGSPTDQMTCGTTGCHGEQSGIPTQMINTDIPELGYTGGEVYTLTLNPSKSGVDKYGFEIVAEDSNGVAVGVFIENVEVNAFLGDHRATHRSTSLLGKGERTWVVEWQAPPKQTGPITFYMASLAANGNDNNFGDSVLIDSLRIEEKISLGLLGCKDTERMSYDPHTQEIHLPMITAGDRVKVMDINGKLHIDCLAHPVLSVSSLSPGMYLILVEGNGENMIMKMVK